jgi:hypothetical protein
MIVCTYVSILRIPQMIWVWRATVEWYWQEKTEELGEKPVPVPLCPPQIPHGLTWERTRASAVRGRRLTTWAFLGNLHVAVSCCSRVLCFSVSTAFAFHFLNELKRHERVPWLKRLVAAPSLRRPGFVPKSVHVEFVVDKVALGLVSVRVLRFLPSI